MIVAGNITKPSFSFFVDHGLISHKLITLCFLVFILLVSLSGCDQANISPTSTPPDCLSDHVDETIQVKKVLDGDTLLLIDGRKVRLIGVNTPELGRNKQRPEPFANRARLAVKMLLNNNQMIKLKYGIEKKDHYGRLLAHGYTIDNQNITTFLLAQGLGSHIIIPPNLSHLGCYQWAEQQAKNDQHGLWQSDYSPLPLSNTQHLRSGFQFIQGEVRSVGKTNASWWIQLAGPVSLYIKPSNQSYFPQTYLDQLVGKEIMVRGWLVRRRAKRSNLNVGPAWIMALPHPFNLEQIDK